MNSQYMVNRMKKKIIKKAEYSYCRGCIAAISHIHLNLTLKVVGQILKTKLAVLQCKWNQSSALWGQDWRFVGA